MNHHKYYIPHILKGVTKPTIPKNSYYDEVKLHTHIHTQALYFYHPKSLDFFATFYYLYYYYYYYYIADNKSM